MQDHIVPKGDITKSENQDADLKCLDQKPAFAIHRKKNTYSGGFLRFEHENGEEENHRKGKKYFSNHKSAVSSNSPQNFKMAYTIIVPKLNPEEQKQDSNNIIAFSSQQLSSPQKPFTHFIDQSVKRLWSKQCPLMGVQRSKLSRTFSNDQRTKSLEKNIKLKQSSPHFINLQLLNNKIQQKLKKHKVQNQSFTPNATQIITLKSKIRSKRNQLAKIIVEGHKQQQLKRRNNLSYIKFERQHFSKQFNFKEDAFRSTYYSSDVDTYLNRTRNFNFKRKKSNFSHNNEQIIQVEAESQVKKSLQYFQFVNLMKKLRQVKKNVVIQKNC